MRRVLDWFRQALRNLRSAEVLFENELYEEVCFESHQAAEKALKALLNSLGIERRGHSLTFLIREVLGKGIDVPRDISECSLMLDKHYIPSRYPDVFDEGAPMDYYSRRDGEECLRCAKKVIEWVKGFVKEYLREV